MQNDYPLISVIKLPIMLTLCKKQHAHTPLLQHSVILWPDSDRNSIILKKKIGKIEACVFLFCTAETDD